MTDQSNRPSHRVVRYYGTGKNAPRAEMGVIWPGNDGRLTIIVNTLGEQIRLTAFPIDDGAATGHSAPASVQ